jgi:hypothetical protein
LPNVDFAIGHEVAIDVLDAHRTGSTGVLDAREARQIRQGNAAIFHSGLEPVEVCGCRTGLGDIAPIVVRGVAGDAVEWRVGGR